MNLPYVNGRYTDNTRRVYGEYMEDKRTNIGIII